MEVALSKRIEVKDAMVRHARILAKSRDPQIRIAASQEELRMQTELDALKAERDVQPQLKLAGAH